MLAGTVQVVAGILGLALGSYAVTAGIRLARAEPSALGRSHCDSCAAALTFAETVPVLSYVGLRGACRRCGGRIDPIHLIGELAGCLVLIGAAMLPDPLAAGLAAVLGLCLVAMSAVDLKIGRLPDALTAVAAFLGAALALHRSPLALLVGLASATAAGVVLLGLRWMRQRVGRDAGLGLGDVKLIAAAGLWLGVATPAMIAIAASLGLLAVLVLRPRDGRIAFGPAIAGATWLIGWLVEYGRWPPVI